MQLRGQTPPLFLYSLVRPTFSPASPVHTSDLLTMQATAEQVPLATAVQRMRDHLSRIGSERQERQQGGTTQSQLLIGQRGGSPEPNVDGVEFVGERNVEQRNAEGYAGAIQLDVSPLGSSAATPIEIGMSPAAEAIDSSPAAEAVQTPLAASAPPPRLASSRAHIWPPGTSVPLALAAALERHREIKDRASQPKSAMPTAALAAASGSPGIVDPSLSTACSPQPPRTPGATQPCPICMEVISPSEAFITCLFCDKSIHRDCMVKCRLNGLRACPLCRADTPTGPGLTPYIRSRRRHFEAEQAVHRATEAVDEAKTQLSATDAQLEDLKANLLRMLSLYRLHEIYVKEAEDDLTKARQSHQEMCEEDSVAVSYHLYPERSSPNLRLRRAASGP